MASDVSADGEPVKVEDAGFDDFVQGNDVVLVDFWAPWCGPCKRVEPVLEEIAEEYEGQVLIGKVNTDENPQTPQKFGIMSIPTLLLFRDGEVVDQMVGALPKPDIVERLEKNL